MKKKDLANLINKSLVTFISIALLGALVMTPACSSPPPEKKAEPAKTEEPAKEPVKKRSMADLNAAASLAVKKLNEKLDSVEFAGFPAWSAKISDPRFNKWVKLTLPVVSSILDQVPEGYVLYIVGHATNFSNSPESKIKDLSRRRAKFIYDSFAKQGLKSNKIKYKGAGTSENTKEGVANRRISFRIEPK